MKRSVFTAYIAGGFILPLLLNSIVDYIPTTRDAMWLYHLVIIAIDFSIGVYVGFFGKLESVGKEGTWYITWKKAIISFVFLTLPILFRVILLYTPYTFKDRFDFWAIFAGVLFVGAIKKKIGVKDD